MVVVLSCRGRLIENKDIVVCDWVPPLTLQEDFPIMSIVVFSFDLKPVNLFERNPILRASPKIEKDSPICRPDSAA
ncbi:hypothetical protein AAC387_Pa01g3247 [Persea americana]